MIVLPALAMPELKLELRLRLPSLAAQLEHNPTWQALVARLEAHPAWRSGAARLEAGRAWLITAFVAAALTLMREGIEDHTRRARWLALFTAQASLEGALRASQASGQADWTCRTNLLNVWRKHYLLWVRFIA